MAIIKNKLHIDEELGLQLKDFRNQFQVKAKDVATHIGKSAAYISKLEKGEIHQIDKEEFVKIVDFISNSESGYQLFCERIIGTMDPESLEFSAIVKNSVEDKRAMREAILPCIFKVIIMVAVLWLVY